MFRMVREVQYRTEYILETDRRLFRNIYVQDPRNNLDHYLILGCLHSTTLREHENYLWRSTRLPLHPQTTPTKEDGLYAPLRWKIPNPKAQEARKNTWILADIWRLVNTRVSMRQDTTRNQGLLLRLSRQITAILKADCQMWV